MTAPHAGEDPAASASAPAEGQIGAPAAPARDRGASGGGNRTSSPDGRMSFLEHLRELRRRLLYGLIAVFLATLVCMAFSPQLFEWLRGPLVHLSRQKLIVLSPIELYITYLKLAILAAVFVSSPFLLLQVWLFVAPGLYPQEKRWLTPFVVLGTIFFVSGGAFAFYGVLPIAFKYLVAAMPETIEAQYSVAIYFSLVTKMMLAFGVVFELPLAMWILSAAGIVDPKKFSRLRRYWIVIAFVVAAVLTPPDPFSQSLMAVPLLLFYEAGVLGARLLYRRTERARSPAQRPG